MELNHTIPTTPMRDAATVLLLRDGPFGLEVFLMQRHVQSAVLGGAYVFPGGKLDREDCHVRPHWLDRPATTLHQALGEPETSVQLASGLYVAALRELHEEAGLLLAEKHSEPTHLGAIASNRLYQHLEAHQMRLQTRLLLPWARWITPVVPAVSSKRFDTRFFVAALPASAAPPRHDDHETMASAWLRPQAALAKYWHGEIELAPPQIMTLAQLSPYANAAAVLSQAANQRPPTILPISGTEDDTRVLYFPGDPKHPDALALIPGAVRLAWRNGRFEPPGGIAALVSPYIRQ